VDDDLVTVVGGPRDGTQFRQIELELIGPEPRKAASVIKSLRRSGAKPSSASKIGIALGERQGKAERPRRRQRRHGRQRRRRHESITDTIRASVKGNLDQLLQHDYRLRISPELPDPHDVHQARVATRRLRSDLNTFAPYLDPVWLHHTREELRWIGTTLGEVRDIDVLSRTISDSGATSLRIYEGTAELVGLVSSGRAEPARELRKAMDSDRYADLLDRLHAAGETPPVNSRARAQTTASKVLPSLVDKRWRSVRRTIRKAGINPGDEELHRIRISAKRLRYAAEVSAPVIGKRARKTGAAAESLQNTLGELRDSEAAEAWLKDMVAQSRFSAEGTFAAGVIARDQELRQERLRRQWRTDWMVVRRRRRRN
jgi:CHAD domain-containing protein